MAGRIRQSDIEEVKARTNIADVVGDYVSLKPAGIGSLKGLCPFHDEKSASFNVRPGVGRYHCFGCGEGGDVYEFLLKLDHVTFTEAVERLAARIGYELHYEEGSRVQSEGAGSRVRILAANAEASEYFRTQLGTPEADLGRRFLGERGFDPAAAEKFQVGFAPNSWDSLTTHLRQRGFSADELIAAGLVSQRDRGIYDRFRGRLVWPIRDVTGQTIGFGARRLRDDDTGPKYLNTPETAVYKKAQVLYGLDLAKRDISRHQQVVIVEGYTDVMACHLAGVTTAVATCGTAFGTDHITVIRRIMGDDSSTGSVIFTFDPDAAGQKAAARAFGEEQRFSAQTYVAVGPEGLDPCDLRLHKGDDAVRRMIAGRKPMFEFMIRHEVDRYDLETVEGRSSALRAAAPIVATIRDPASQDGYTRELARLSGAELTDAVRAVRAAKSRGQAERATQQGPNETPQANVPSVPIDSRDPTVRTEREAMMAILQLPTEVGLARIERVVRVPFTHPTLAVIRDAILAVVHTATEPGWIDRVQREVPTAYASTVNALAVATLPQAGADLGRYARAVVNGLIDRDLLRQKAELTARLARTDTADQDARRALQIDLADIDKERMKLRNDEE